MIASEHVLVHRVLAMVMEAPSFRVILKVFLYLGVSYWNGFMRTMQYYSWVKERLADRLANHELLDSYPDSIERLGSLIICGGFSEDH